MSILNFKKFWNKFFSQKKPSTSQKLKLSPLVFSESKKENIKIIKFNWHLDESNVKTEGEKMYQYIENLPKNSSLIFDFENLEYLNSLWLGYISDWHIKINNQNGQIIIANVNENILDILEVIGLNNVIPIVNNIDLAFKKL